MRWAGKCFLLKSTSSKLGLGWGELTAEYKLHSGLSHKTTKKEGCSFYVSAARQGFDCLSSCSWIKHPRLQHAVALYPSFTCAGNLILMMTVSQWRRAPLSPLHRRWSWSSIICRFRQTNRKVGLLHFHRLNFCDGMSSSSCSGHQGADMHHWLEQLPWKRLLSGTFSPQCWILEHIFIRCEAFWTIFCRTTKLQSAEAKTFTEKHLVFFFFRVFRVHIWFINWILFLCRKVWLCGNRPKTSFKSVSQILSDRKFSDGFCQVFSLVYLVRVFFLLFYVLPEHWLRVQIGRIYTAKTGLLWSLTPLAEFLQISKEICQRGKKNSLTVNSYFRMQL